MGYLTCGWKGNVENFEITTGGSSGVHNSFFNSGGNPVLQGYGEQSSTVIGNLFKKIGKAFERLLNKKHKAKIGKHSMQLGNAGGGLGKNTDESVTEPTTDRDKDLMEEARKKMDAELLDSQGQPIFTLSEFYLSNYDLTEEQIINQEEDQIKTFLGSQKGGPTLRYVKDPLNPNAVIDMRHMLIVGRSTEFIANSVELAGVIFGNEGHYRSGADYQDYYSNDLGRRFYGVYGERIKRNPKLFIYYLYIYNGY